MPPDGSVAAALSAARAQLEAAGVPTPDVDAALLVAHVTGWSRSRVRTSADEPLPRGAADALAELVRRRAAREPLQLLLGSIGFRHLDVEVRPGVFIPRPETETLAGEAIARTPRGGLVVEPCTGTGAVACAVATEAAALVHATDVSTDAVALARANAAATGARVEVHHGDLFAPLPAELRGRVDVVVSNPPYIADAEVSDRLIAEAPGWLRPGGWLLMEVDAARAAEAASRCRAAGYVEVEVVRDLAGRDRVVIARYPPTVQRAGS